MIFPNHLESKIMCALRESHPYEEVAYYLTRLENENQEVGAGIIGELETAVEPMAFLERLKIITPGCGRGNWAPDRIVRRK